MGLLASPLIGYGFVQAVSLYGEASAAALQSPALATSLSPLDGVLVPTFGALYVAVTLLFPFVAIRVLAQEKETGALRLLVQLPYDTAHLMFAKFLAVLGAWILASIPALSAIILWVALGGHLGPAETLNLLFGHLLYGSLVGAIALFAASISESGATAAIIALALTIGSWVLDFTIAGRTGWLAWIARLSLTQTLRTFEQGLFAADLVLGMSVAICGFAVLAGVFLRPGVPIRTRFLRAATCVLATAIAIELAAQLPLSVDVSEDRRNSFPSADQRQLATMSLPLVVTAHLAPEDPRYADLQRNVLAKLKRAMPNVTIQLAPGGQSLASSVGDDTYGIVAYVYGGRADTSRSTSHREILPLLYRLADLNPPSPDSASDFPGYPLIANADPTLLWFFGGLPMLIVLVWWWSRRPPPLNPALARRGG
jgi:ABC-type transport system involved in multi-copper enzyme maturation permease subunit